LKKPEDSSQGGTGGGTVPAGVPALRRRLLSGAAAGTASGVVTEVEVVSPLCKSPDVDTVRLASSSALICALLSGALLRVPLFRTFELANGLS
jgi:hypothetical protein